MINIGYKQGIFGWFLCLLILAHTAAMAQTPASQTPTDAPAPQSAATPRTSGAGLIPANLQVPNGSKLLLHAYARGVQMYTCVQVPTDTARYVWTFVEPRAGLYSRNDYKQQIGKHYFTTDNYPVWESTDGSKVTGAKVQQADAPDTSAIPWLLLKGTAWDGYGPLRSATLIQRINTKGGKAPATGADRAHNGQYIRVPYTAEYLFYKTVP